MVELQLIFAHSFLFICIWLRGSPLLRGFSSNCHEWGCSLVAVLGLLVAEYRLWGAQTPVARGLRSRSSRALGAGFSSRGARALGCTDPGSCGTRAPQSQLPGSRGQASVVAEHRLSCSMACGIFLGQGSNTSPALADGFLSTAPPE